MKIHLFLIGPIKDIPSGQPQTRESVMAVLGNGVNSTPQSKKPCYTECPTRGHAIPDITRHVERRHSHMQVHSALIHKTLDEVE